VAGGESLADNQAFVPRSLNLLLRPRRHGLDVPPEPLDAPEQVAGLGVACLLTHRERWSKSWSGSGAPSGYRRRSGNARGVLGGDLVERVLVLLGDDLGGARHAPRKPMLTRLPVTSRDLPAASFAVTMPRTSLPVVSRLRWRRSSKSAGLCGAWHDPRSGRVLSNDVAEHCMRYGDSRCQTVSPFSASTRTPPRRTSS
jgi:hypothetical protein